MKTKTSKKEKKRLFLITTTIILLLVVLVGSVFKDWKQIIKNRQLEQVKNEKIEDLNNEIDDIGINKYFLYSKRKIEIYCKFNRKSPKVKRRKEKICRMENMK